MDLQMTTNQFNVSVHISNQEPLPEHYSSSRWIDRAPPEICAISQVVTITEHVEESPKNDAFQVLMAKKPSFKFTDEQNAVVQEVVDGDGSLFVTAVAGSGKTSTIEECMRVIKKKRPEITFAYTCYTKANVDEAVKRLKGIIKVKENDQNKQVATLNSRGLKVLRRTYGESVGTNTEKYNDKTIDKLLSHGYLPSPYPSLLTDDEAKKLVGNFNKQKIKDIIDSTVVQKKSCSFAEQVVLPALMPDMEFEEPVDILFIDECQDLSEINIRLIERMRPKRVVAVGDRRQAIYAFRGAHQRAVDEMERRFDMKEMTLSISFRCPSVIAAHAGGMTSSKEGGVVRDGTIAEIQPGDAVLCRFNAPLDGLACDLLEKGHVVATERLLAVANHHDYRVGTLCRSIKTNNPSLKLTLARHKTIGDLRKALKSPQCIKLMTFHKSKGLEFNRVNIVREDMHTDDPQSDNLVYVARTRAMSELIYI
jgi:superfamily I DNA/RNA helicase